MLETRDNVATRDKTTLEAKKADFLRAQINQMESVATQFYWELQRNSVPYAFREFCGFIREYVNMCRDALNAGIDFNEIRKRGNGQERELPLERSRIEFLGARFATIFDQWFQTQQRVDAFLVAADMRHPALPQNDVELARAFEMVEHALVRRYGGVATLTLGKAQGVEVTACDGRTAHGLSLWDAFRARPS